MFEKEIGRCFEIRFDRVEEFEKNKAILNELSSLRIDTSNIRKIYFSDHARDFERNGSMRVTINNKIHEEKTVIESSFRQVTFDEILKIFKLPPEIIECLFVITIGETYLQLNVRYEALLSFINNGIQECIKIENGKVTSCDSVVAYVLRGYEEIGPTKEIINIFHEKALEENIKITTELLLNELTNDSNKFNIIKKVMEEFKKDKMVIHCPTEKLAIELLIAAHTCGFKWCDGESYLKNNNWGNYKEKTVYHLYKGEYGELKNCGNVIEFKGFNEYFESPKNEQPKAIEEIIALYCIENQDDAIQNIENIKEVAQTWFNSQKCYKEVISKIKRFDFEIKIENYVYDIKNLTFFQLARLEDVEFEYLEGSGYDQYYDLVTVSAWDGYELAIPVPVLAEYLRIPTQDIYDAFEKMGKIHDRDDVEFI